MIRFALFLTMTISSAHAYVPTVESLFRHGGNADITTNGVSLSLTIKRLHKAERAENPNDISHLKEAKGEDYYKLFFTKAGAEAMKVAQTRYNNASYSESSLREKVYFSNFTAYTLKATMEDAEKGLFFAMLRSTLFNDGSFLINYLKSLNIPVRLNKELINREKVEFLAGYKQYLAAINRDRTLKKTLPNPLKPEDAASRERVNRIMNESMYVDTKQVKITRDNGQLSWLVDAGQFEAVISYQQREIQKIKFKSQLGEYEINCREYWLANGSHSVPRFITIRDYKGDHYQIEVTNLRHYQEKEDDLIKRLHSWDNVLKGKEYSEAKPSFLL
jgi:hypothetical protein